MSGGAADPHLNDSNITRWWFQICSIVTATGIWGYDPTWLICFRWVAQPPIRSECYSVSFTLFMSHLRRLRRKTLKNSSLKPSNVAQWFVSLWAAVNVWDGVSPKKKWPSNRSRRRACFRKTSWSKASKCQTSRYRTCSSLYALLLMAVQSLLQRLMLG